MAADQDFEPTSTRPYLVRALHEWCCDNGFTPYINVFVDASVQAPLEYVKDGEIVLNIGLDATTALRLGNDYLEFKARFAGTVREIMVPIDHVLAIFSRETGQGMAFPKPESVLQREPPRAVVSLVTAASAVASDSLVEGNQTALLDDSAITRLGNVSTMKPKAALTRIK